MRVIVFVSEETTDSGKLSDVLVVPNRSGSRYIEHIFPFPESESNPKIFKDFFTKGSREYKDQTIVDFLLEVINQKYFNDCYFYIPMRDPVDQYCSCLDLLQFWQHMPEQRFGNIRDKLDTFTWGVAKMDAALDYFRNSKTKVSDYAGIDVAHFTPTVIIPFYLLLCRAKHIKTLDLKQDELTNFVRAKNPKKLESLANADNNKVIMTNTTGYQTRKAPREYGKEVYDWLCDSEAMFNIWIGYYDRIYQELVKDLNTRSFEDNYIIAIRLYLDLYLDKRFQYVCESEYERMVKYSNLFGINLPTLPTNEL